MENLLANFNQDFANKDKKNNAIKSVSDKIDFTNIANKINEKISTLEPSILYVTKLYISIEITPADNLLIKSRLEITSSPDKIKRTFSPFTHNLSIYGVIEDFNRDNFDKELLDKKINDVITVSVVNAKAIGFDISLFDLTKDVVIGIKV